MQQSYFKPKMASNKVLQPETGQEHSTSDENGSESQDPNKLSDKIRAEIRTMRDLLLKYSPCVNKLSEAGYVMPSGPGTGKTTSIKQMFEMYEIHETVTV